MATNGSIVAVAIQADVKQDNGVINEGEPSANYDVDPEGSVTVVTIHTDVSDWSTVVADEINFNSFDTQKAQLKA